MQQTRIIDDLLDVTRITAGKLHLQQEAVILDTLVWSVVERMEPDARAKSITLARERAPSEICIQGDSGRLRQVFVNIIGNAIKFTPVRGRVTVRVEAVAASAEAVVEVSDTGIGLTAAETARLFHRFSQGEHSREEPPRYGGLGLGLLISKNLVEQHGGVLTAQSDGRGRGSTFTVRLPLKRRPGE